MPSVRLGWLFIYFYGKLRQVQFVKGGDDPNKKQGGGGMVMSLDSKPRKVRQWYKDHIYCMYNFRILFEQEQITTDPQEKKRLRAKQEHSRKKVEQHMARGKSLDIDDVQIRNFNLAIIDEVKKRKKPKAIIQTLIQENGQK